LKNIKTLTTWNARWRGHDLIGSIRTLKGKSLLTQLREMDLKGFEARDFFDVGFNDEPNSNYMPKYFEDVEEFQLFFKSLPALKCITCSLSLASRLPILPSLIRLELFDVDWKDVPNGSLSALSGCGSLRALISTNNVRVGEGVLRRFEDRVDISHMPNLEEVDFDLVNLGMGHYLVELCYTLAAHPNLQSISISHADCMRSMPKQRDAFIESFIGVMATQPIHVQRLLMGAVIIWSDRETPYERTTFLEAAAEYASEPTLRQVLSLPTYNPETLLLRPRKELACPLVSMYDHQSRFRTMFRQSLNSKCVEKALCNPRFQTDLVPQLLRCGELWLVQYLHGMGILRKPEGIIQSRNILMAACSSGNDVRTWEWASTLSPPIFPAGSSFDEQKAADHLSVCCEQDASFGTAFSTSLFKTSWIASSTTLKDSSTFFARKSSLFRKRNSTMPSFAPTNTNPTSTRQQRL
jgi:hypothetical protein